MLKSYQRLVTKLKQLAMAEEQLKAMLKGYRPEGVQSKKAAAIWAAAFRDQFTITTV